MDDFLVLLLVGFVIGFGDLFGIVYCDDVLWLMIFGEREKYVVVLGLVLEKSGWGYVVMLVSI